MSVWSGAIAAATVTIEPSSAESVFVPMIASLTTSAMGVSFAEEMTRLIASLFDSI